MPNSLPARPYVRRVSENKPVRIRRRLATITGLGLAGLLAGLLSGCSLSSSSISAAAPATAGTGGTSWAQLSGNWGFTATAGTPVSATRLSSLGGSLAVTGSTVTATLHPLVAGQCIGTSEVLTMTGTVTPDGAIALAGESAKGVSVKIGGTVSAGGHSLDNPALTAVGGACTGAISHLAGEARPHDNGGTTAQQYQPVTGTYSGTLTDSDGESFPLTTTVTQVDQPDTDGTYHIQGSATAPDNPCVPSAVTATASVLTGGTISATYTDGNGTTISATGFASADGSTIALTNWQVTSSCGTDSGTATLTRQ